MSIRILAAVLAVVAVPVAVVAQQPGTEKKAKAERRYCVVDNDPSSRLRGAVRRCYTREERDAMRAEARKSIDIIQTRRASN